MILQVGQTTKGYEAKGPACDRISARSVVAIVGNKRAAATLCHSKPWQTRLELGRNPSAKSTHEGNSKLTSCNSRPHLRTDYKPTEGISPRETCQDAPAYRGVSVPDHMHAVGPAGPVSS